MSEGPDLNLVHRIDQSQASAFQRTSNLLEWVDDWINNQGFTRGEMLDALDDPMLFMAVLKIMQQRVSVTELPNMCAALVIRITRDKLERK